MNHPATANRSCLSSPVLVVGAGPVGLAAALELARLGIPVRIIDREPTPSAHSKAIGINARTMELLEPSGATEEMLALGLRIRSLRFRTDGRLRLAVPFARLDHRYGFMLALGRSALLAFGYNPPGTYRIVSSGGDPIELLPHGSRVHEVLWTSDFQISRCQAISYQRGRVFLAGDAAHLHSPLGARGMNLGIEDAAVLAHKIARGGLDSYSTERHRAGAAVLRMTHAQTVLATTRSRLLRTLRDHVLLPVLSFAPVQRRVLREVMGLGTPAFRPVAH